MFIWANFYRKPWIFFCLVNVLILSWGDFWFSNSISWIFKIQILTSTISLGPHDGIKFRSIKNRICCRPGIYNFYSYLLTLILTGGWYEKMSYGLWQILNFLLQLGDRGDMTPTTYFWSIIFSWRGVMIWPDLNNKIWVTKNSNQPFMVWVIFPWTIFYCFQSLMTTISCTVKKNW